MPDAPHRCRRTGVSPETRFDGWFVVVGAGTYCRPSCSTRAGDGDDVRHLPSASSAAAQGLQPCPRCRPDRTPGSPVWAGRDDLVARAMRLITDGRLDRDDDADLAHRLGCSVATLRTALLAETGLDPAGLAGYQWAQTARLLLDETDLPLPAVAAAAGFTDIGEFIATATAALAVAGPARRGADSPTAPSTTPGAPLTVTLRLMVLRPFASAGVFGHLAASAVPGCEEVRDGALRRTLRLAHGRGIVSLWPQADHVRCRLWLDSARDIGPAIAACRRLLDLDADPRPVLETLEADPLLAPLVATAPGQRLPRSVDGAELAIRVVLGQQVSLKAARTHAGRLVRTYGEPIHDPTGGLTHLFPTPEQLAGLAPASLALPQARRRTLLALIATLADGRIALDEGADRMQARRELLALPGIGPWTAEVIALRGLGDPDAFPVTDLGVRNAAERLGLPITPAALTAHAEQWRPWRSYATQQLWAALDHPVNDWPPKEAA